MAFEESCASASAPKSTSHPHMHAEIPKISQSIPTPRLLSAVTSTIITTTKGCVPVAMSTTITTDETCDCRHEHHHHHDEACDCGHEHHHHHDETCGCDHEHHHHEHHEHHAAAHTSRKHGKLRVYTLQNLGCAHCAAEMQYQSAVWTVYTTARWCLNPVSCA